LEKEQLVFRLAALINEVWFYQGTERLKIQYPGLQSVTLDNSTLDSCKIFYSDSMTPLWVDDEVSVLIAPEIGFAMISASGGVMRTLTKAIINGTTYQF
jgi:hypothetical protein